ncbi:hypothetical protein [uncultured Polaribacter sp.]|uniref:hypothetical protein n=1 Tax=uncultured Polaribacter sp. TaxID=174711 RepID=UPI00263201BA|nr:hypothetical protein [uncultured Polaribacter sp.]
MKKTALFSKEHDLNILLQHVPLIIYAPKFIHPKLIQKNGKLIDLFPTLIHLAKVNPTNYTLGTDLLDTNYINIASFVYLKINGEPAAGLLQDSLYYSKNNSTNGSGVYHLNEKSLVDIKAKLPLKTKEMDRLLEAYYHTTKYLYFNNKKLVE